VIIYYSNPPPGVSPKLHIFWKTFTVIEMVGRMNIKASQHNKKAIVVHIDRVLDFHATGSEKEQTENIQCIRIDLEAKREWARIDREKGLGQQEDEEEDEEDEVQWHIRRQTPGASLLHPSSSATRQPVMVPKTTPPPSPPTALAESNRELLSTPRPSSSSGTRQPPLIPPIAKKKRKSRRRWEAELPPQPAQAEGHRDRGAAALLRRAARATRAEQQAERLDTGCLDSFTQMGVAIYSSNNKLLVPGRIQQDPAAVADNGAAAMQMSEQTGPASSRRQEEDPAAVVEPNAAMLMLEQKEPTSRQPTHTRSSRSLPLEPRLVKQKSP
jgi:hypothetical protein